MDGKFNENDLSRVVEADRAHIWHHLSQHKPYETTDPRIIVEGRGMKVTARDLATLVRDTQVEQMRKKSLAPKHESLIDELIVDERRGADQRRLAFRGLGRG